ncbi:MAG: transposase [Acidimicrobiia bacterium]|nr:transposase [Acidimicrobiia bacterium]
MLQHLYGIHLARDSDEANQALGAFIEIYKDHPLLEYETLVGTLLECGDEIFAFHDTDRATNGRIEGSNNKLGVLKRVAYGFVNVTNFAARAPPPHPRHGNITMTENRSQPNSTRRTGFLCMHQHCFDGKPIYLGLLLKSGGCGFALCLIRAATSAKPWVATVVQRRLLPIEEDSTVSTGGRSEPNLTPLHRPSLTSPPRAPMPRPRSRTDRVSRAFPGTHPDPLGPERHELRRRRRHAPRPTR